MREHIGLVKEIRHSSFESDLAPQHTLFSGEFHAFRHSRLVYKTRKLCLVCFLQLQHAKTIGTEYVRGGRRWVYRLAAMHLVDSLRKITRYDTVCKLPV